MAIRLFVPKGQDERTLVLAVQGLGDVFLALSFGLADIAAFAEAKGRKAVIVVSHEQKDFIACLGLFSEVIPLEKVRFSRDVAYLSRMLFRLRRLGCGRLLQMRMARFFLLEDLITFAVAPREALSPVGDRRNISAYLAKVTDRLYRPIAHVGTALHDLDGNSRVVRALTGHAPRRMELPQYDLPAALALPRPYYILAPTAGQPFRQWPENKFQAIAERVKRLGYHCAVTGTNADYEIGERLGSAVDGINLCGRLSVAQLVEAVRHAAFVLCNETSICHIAAYVNVPSIVLLGGGHHGIFVPYPDGWPELMQPQAAVSRMPCFNCNWQCRYDVGAGMPFPCVERIDIDAVWKMVEAVTADRPPL